jgi:hypothetical protein
LRVGDTSRLFAGETLPGPRVFLGWSRRRTNPTDNARAMEAFRKTIALDPGYADAYATLSNGQSTSGSVTAKAGAATLMSGSGASKTITRPTTSSNP